MKKIYFGVIASAFFLYLSFRGIEYSDIKNSFANVDLLYLLYALFFFILVLFIKSIRWGIILSPIEQVSQKCLFPITCVSNMAVILFPLRIGEFVKPYLISNSNSIPLSSAFATVFVEKIIDLVFIFSIIIYIFITLDIPEWLISAGYNFLISCLLLSCIGVICYLNIKFRNRLLNPLLKILGKIFSERVYKRIQNAFETFIQGFKIISELKKVLFVIVLTILMWTSAALAIYSLYCFQGLHLSVESAFIVLAIIAIGVSVPTAPGFLGNFQFACILALSIFNISKTDAVAFSIIYYVCGIVFYIVLGLAFVPFTNFSLKNIKQKLFLKQNDL